MFLGIITGNRQQLKEPEDHLMDPMEEAALEQMIKYTFIGGPEKVKKELENFIEITKIDELMVASAIYEHQARLHSYEILGQLNKPQN